jgi:hypothetical protein
MLQFRQILDCDATHGGPLVHSRSGDNQQFDLSALKSFFLVKVLDRRNWYMLELLIHNNWIISLKTELL